LSNSVSRNQKSNNQIKNILKTSKNEKQIKNGLGSILKSNDQGVNQYRASFINPVFSQHELENRLKKIGIDITVKPDRQRENQLPLEA
jgi:hypothetical protein